MRKSSKVKSVKQNGKKQKKTTVNSLHVWNDLILLSQWDQFGTSIDFDHRKFHSVFANEFGQSFSVDRQFERLQWRRTRWIILSEIAFKLSSFVATKIQWTIENTIASTTTTTTKNGVWVIVVFGSNSSNDSPKTVEWFAETASLVAGILCYAGRIEIWLFCAGV